MCSFYRISIFNDRFAAQMPLSLPCERCFHQLDLFLRTCLPFRSIFLVSLVLCIFDSYYDSRRFTLSRPYRDDRFTADAKKASYTYDVLIVGVGAQRTGYI